MAQIDAKNKLVSVKAFARANPLPIDVSTVFDSLEEATTYASTDPTVYDLQIIGVNNGGSPECYIIFDKKLYPVSGSQTIVVANEAEMLALKDAKVGTMVFRSDLGRFFILINSDPSIADSWRTETKQDPQWGTF